MEYRQLGRSGLRVSVLTLGTMTFGGRGFFAKAGTLSPQPEAVGGPSPAGLGRTPGLRRGQALRRDRGDGGDRARTRRLGGAGGSRLAPRSPGVTSLVIGARREEQLLDNIEAAGLKLSDAERGRLDKVS